MSDVLVKINGESVGNASGSDQLGATVQRYATDRGIKTYTVSINGRKADTKEAPQTLSALSAQVVEITTKDARGAGRKAAPRKSGKTAHAKAGRKAVRRAAVSHPRPPASPWRKGAAVEVISSDAGGRSGRTGSIQGPGFAAGTFEVMIEGTAYQVPQSNLRLLSEQ